MFHRLLLLVVVHKFSHFATYKSFIQLEHFFPTNHDISAAKCCKKAWTRPCLYIG